MIVIDAARTACKLRPGGDRWQHSLTLVRSRPGLSGHPPDKEGGREEGRGLAEGRRKGICLARERERERDLCQWTTDALTMVWLFTKFMTVCRLRFLDSFVLVYTDGKSQFTEQTGSYW